MSDLETNLRGRRELILALAAELLGPDPQGESCALSPVTETELSLETWSRPKRQPGGDEILWQDPPLSRYGAGILFPRATTDETTRAADDDSEAAWISEADSAEQRGGERVEQRGGALDEAAADEDVCLANALKPSAMGLSFLADFSRETAGFEVQISDRRRLGRGDDDLVDVIPGIYLKATARVRSSSGKDFQRKVWLRKALSEAQQTPFRVAFTATEILKAHSLIRRRVPTTDAAIEIVVVARPWPTGDTGSRRLVTVSLVNCAEATRRDIDGRALFQAGFVISGQSSPDWIIPYPEIEYSQLHATRPATPYDDEAINEILYDRFRTFAVGHGCGTDWISGTPGTVASVWTSTLPVYELPAVSAELRTSPAGSESGGQLRVSMQRLAGLDKTDNGEGEIRELLAQYAAWIERLSALAEKRADLDEDARRLARGIVSRCRTCHDRILSGWSYITGDTPDQKRARQAFQLANHAMLLSQLRAAQAPRSATLTSDGKLSWDRPFESSDETVPQQRFGYWRPFQIAFLLMSVRGVCDPDHEDRGTVDLIWFPTGGGKTEAYLGLTAFTLILDRLRGTRREGAAVLMRYTLRLLTAQQFQRAATLFCALESLRRRLGPELLGKDPMRVGLWVGGETTPNKRKDALHALRELERADNAGDARNPFILRRCPWCGARFGLVHTPAGGARGRHRDRPRLVGYYREGISASEQTVVLRCPDESCPFGASVRRKTDPLPVALIDEDIYDAPPALVIGTVDKFAMLAWRPEVRCLFGISNNGHHAGEPPSLIIQDELHLISGPLGSMVGAYEGLIELLCRRCTAEGIAPGLPKIVASTATISRAYEQIRHLYARERVALFPPPGLDASDSFFARYATDAEGMPSPGRLYVGTFAPGHGSLQTTQARVFATLLQTAATLSDDASARDPWWTLLCFFNSLRELGSAGSLFAADVRDYLAVIRDRKGIPRDKVRHVAEVDELTSRIRSDEIPARLERLEVAHTDARSYSGDVAYDACLASNIIEVGVDVPRLGVMCLVGQPKTTSQYIQVSSRVGRRADCPGLAVVLYGPSKPRDRSHYEKFRPYHQRIYAQVEPTSVTPFSSPAIERALHAVIVGIVRQLGRRSIESRSPDPFPLGEGTALRDVIETMLEDRVACVSPDQRRQVREALRLRLDQWSAWAPGAYGNFTADGADPMLLYPAGQTPPQDWNGRGWPTPTSMRGVDATCEAVVTDYFHRHDAATQTEQPS